MKVIKWMAIVVIALVALVLISAVVLPVIFKDDLIALVKEQANQNLNAKVDFGEFDLSLLSSFPDFSFEINDVSVAGVGVFEGDTLLSIGNLLLTVDVLSVLRGNEIALKTISIDRLRAHAKVLADGRANWDIAKEDTTVQPEEVPEKEEPDTGAPLKLSLKRFSITNSDLLYEDDQGGMSANVENLHFSLSGDFTEKFTTLGLKTTIASLSFTMDKIPYLNKTKLEFNAGIDADLAHATYTFRENEFRLNNLALGWEGSLTMPDSGDMTMDLRFAAKKTEFKDLLSLVPAVYTNDFADVKTSGKLELQGFAKGIYREGHLPAFEIKLLVENAMFRYPDLPSSAEKININVRIANPGGSEDNTLIDVSSFHVELAGNPIDLHLMLKTPLSDPQIDCGVKGEIDLSKLKDVVPLEKGEEMSGLIRSDIVLQGKLSTIEQERYEEFTAAGDLNIENLNYKSADFPQGALIEKMNMHFTPKYVNLTSFDCKTGSSDLHATGTIENFIAYALTDSAILAGRYQLSSRLLDLNELMAEQAGDSTAAAQDTAAEDTIPLSVIEVPGNIDFSLASSFDRILYDKMDMRFVKGLLIVRDHRLVMENLSMNLLDGSMTLSGSYDTKDPEKPAVDFRMDIRDWDIPSTFETFNTVQKLAPIAEHCSGKLSTGLTFKASLDEQMKPILSSMNGGGGLKTKKVIIEGSETINKMADALKNEKYKRLQLEDINTTYEFREGRLHVKPFDVKIGNSTAKIYGSNGFDQTLDYTMLLTVPTSEFGGGVGSFLGNLTSLAGTAGVDVKIDKLSVEILIQGTVMKPVVKIGNVMPAGGEKPLKEQVKEEIIKKVEEIKEEAIDMAKEKAREEAERLLKEAEKQANQIRSEARNLSDQVKKEGYKQADELEKKGANPFEKIANKKLAEVARKEADKKAQKINEEADRKAQQLLDDAKRKADQLLQSPK